MLLPAGYAWPRNVRQLRKVLRFALAVCDGEMITPENLPGERMAAIEAFPVALQEAPLPADTGRRGGAPLESALRCQR